MNIARKVLYGSIAALLITMAAQAKSPVEGKWTQGVNNGFGGTLDLQVDNTGIVTGTAFGDNIQGFWDDSTGKLVFYRAIKSQIINGTLQMNPEYIQVFTGYLFNYKTSNTMFGELQILTGTFESFAGTGATTQKTVYGWFAQRAAQ